MDNAILDRSHFPKLGIIAGSGVLPARLIEFCRSTKQSFVVVALQNHADETVLPNDCPIKWVRLGAVGKIYRFMKKEAVKEIVMIGGVRRPSLAEIYPDFFGLRFLARIGLSKKGDDGLLRDIIKAIEELGFKVRGFHELMPDFLAPAGVWTYTKPADEDMADIARGCYTAQLLGLADVGQSVVVQNGLVLAVEGVEGTRRLLERSGELRRKKAKKAGTSGVLVKMMKPQQETRADMPTIGVQTVESVVQAGLGGIAVEADKVLVPDIQEVMQAADKAGIFVMGIRAADVVPSSVLKLMTELHTNMEKMRSRKQ